MIASILILVALGIGIMQPTTNTEAQTDSYQYVPFKISGPDSIFTCRDRGPTAEGPVDQVFIESAQDRDFLITSIFMRVTGVNLGDLLVVGNFRIDGFLHKSNAREPPLLPFSFDRSFELLGVTSFDQKTAPTTPHQIALSGDDGLSGLGKDLVMGINCISVGKGEIVFPIDGTAISGWKHVDDTITITFRHP